VIDAEAPDIDLAPLGQLLADQAVMKVFHAARQDIEIVYAKAGNIWVQTGKQARELTTGGNDSMPSWSPDGATIYFVRTVNAVGHWPASGVIREYQETVPSIMQVKADGSAAYTLLGVSFLSRLKRYEYANGRMVLEQ